MTKEDERLLAEARRTREFAYAPYSRFAVGAAVLGTSGKIYGGCNVENGAFSLTNCAERTAIFQAVAGKPRFVRWQSSPIPLPRYRLAAPAAR